MNNQEAFDIVWDHFIIKGNAKSMNTNCCVYRSEDGNKCAFGLLIPEEFYSRRFEGNVASQILSMNHDTHDKFFDVSVVDLAIKIQEHLVGVDRSLIIALQNAHDSFPFSNLRQRLELISERFNLKLPENT